MQATSSASARRLWRRLMAAILPVLLLLAIDGCAGPAPDAGEGVKTPGGTPEPLPQFAHVVVVVEENHSYDEIIGSADAPYLNALAARGAVFTDAHGVTHPSQPNYLALFAGSTFGLASDDCPQQLTGPTLATALLADGLTFTAYSEDLPRAGYSGCQSGGDDFDPLYARKHAPWTNFAALPASINQPFTSFPTDFSQLPAVAFVVPNQQDDMHSGSVAAGDSWLQEQLGSYAQWAPTHNSLLIVTWDEDDGSTANHILTLFVGAHVQPGRYGETINHYDVLRTIEAIFALPYTNAAAQATTIADVWQA
ncbi:MAG TPA: alkaline phosphatase family protein [Ktedonobacterales bacterium]